MRASSPVQPTAGARNAPEVTLGQADRSLPIPASIFGEEEADESAPEDASALMLPLAWPPKPPAATRAPSVPQGLDVAFAYAEVALACARAPSCALHLHPSHVCTRWHASRTAVEFCIMVLSVQLFAFQFLMRFVEHWRHPCLIHLTPLSVFVSGRVRVCLYVDVCAEKDTFSTR